MTKKFYMQTDLESISHLKTMVGNTPLRKCSFLSLRYHTNVFVKEEFHNNPGMSSKDRPALFMLEDAIRGKKIKKDGIFVEASSGNTGVSIALLAKRLGYRSKIFISGKTSVEKTDLLKSIGACVEICENSNGLEDPHSTQSRAQAFVDENPDAYFTNQYYNPQNLHAHYQTTGPEIWEQTGGQVTHFVAGIGTGGTISGVGKYLKEKNSTVSVWGVEPRGSVLAGFLETGKLPGGKVSFDCIDGIGRNFIPGSFDPRFVDNIFQVDLEGTRATAHEYTGKTGFLPGFSSAAVLAAMDRHISTMNLNYLHTLVLLFPDHGSRYLSKLYTPNKSTLTA